MQLQLQTWPEVDAYLRTSRGIIIPIVTTEQHGLIGLIGTDAICAEVIARGVGEAAGALLALAGEATASGDRIAAENFYQHAEHYFRIDNARRESNQKGTPPRPTTPADVAGATLLKDAAFRPEREVRIVAVPDSKRLSDQAAKEYPDEFKVMPLPEVRGLRGAMPRFSMLSV
jgi:hypothetical protein